MLWPESATLSPAIWSDRNFELLDFESYCVGRDRNSLSLPWTYASIMTEIALGDAIYVEEISIYWGIQQKNSPRELRAKSTIKLADQCWTAVIGHIEVMATEFVLEFRTRTQPGNPETLTLVEPDSGRTAVSLLHPGKPSNLWLQSLLW